MLKLLKSFFQREKTTHYTTDGGNLAPYPNMTDEDLQDFERYFDVPNKTIFVPKEPADEA